MRKKIVIAPDDAKAIAFFEELDNKKQALKKKIEAKLEAMSSNISKQKRNRTSTSANQ